MLDLCFCIHDNSGSYYKNTLISLFSVFDNTCERIHTHIFCDETLTLDARAMFDELGNRYNQKISYYSMHDIEFDILKNIPDKFGRGSLYRLFIPELLSADRILYLDSDIICTLDIREIFEEAPHDYCICGVVDAGQIRHRRSAQRLRKIGLTPERYINSGVLLMNLGRLRKRRPSWREDIFSLFTAKRWIFPDQDAINSYLAPYADGIAFLPEKFNYCVNIENRSYLDPTAYNGKILHYTKEKPWHVLSPASLLYWQYYMRFFNDSSIIDTLRGLRQPDDAALFDFLLRNESIKRMVRKAYDVHTKGLLPTIRKKLRL